MDDAGKYTAEHKRLIEENKALRKQLEEPKLNGKEVSKGLTL